MERNFELEDHLYVYLLGGEGGGEMVKKLHRQNEHVCKCLHMSTGGREGYAVKRLPVKRLPVKRLPVKRQLC